APRRTEASPALALAAMRAILTRKRGLTPYSQAGMHLPLLVQTWAQRSASGVPAPPPIRSIRPVTIAGAFAPLLPVSIPAGSIIGQAVTHFPHRVQASRLASTRPCRASRKEGPPASAVMP